MGLAIPNIYGSTPAGTFSYYGEIYSQLINSESNKAKLQLLNTSTGKFKFTRGEDDCWTVVDTSTASLSLASSELAQTRLELAPELARVLS